VWAGEVLHVLGRRDDDSSLEIWSKEIRLVNMAQPLQSLGFII
jgi:hypothetical protein